MSRTFISFFSAGDFQVLNSIAHQIVGQDAIMSHKFCQYCYSAAKLHQEYSTLRHEAGQMQQK